jgi:radical SAM protein with 4Fe4S-binding SPASM domain
MTANKKGSFDRVIKGMEKAVAQGIPINLRSVIDKENVDDLVALAQLLDDRGWLDLPPTLFKTQIGRNYELFECYEKPEHLFTQVELWAYVAKLAEAHPVLKKFHRPDFMGIRYLVDTGEMYLPSFDTCPAAKTEWVFDLYGDIYGCTASCGREEFKLGTYWPEITKNEEAIQTWKNRDVTNIEKCKSCKYDIVCGGGCGVVAANRHDGEILSPDCRPIQELYDIGLNFYNEEIHDLMKAEESGSTVEPETSTKQEANTGQNRGESTQSGCMICGESLVYWGKSVSQQCDICGEMFQSNISCANGHYVCDNCHRGDTLDHMEALLIKSTKTNPILLADAVFHLPTMKMHGPEHHSMVPAVIETAYQNLQGIRDLDKIRETIRRGKDIKGGSCGYHGTCGACVGAGIAESVHLGAKPSSKEERGSAMRATGSALLAISEFGGPLCCKRDSIASIENYMEHSDRFAKAEPAVYICSFSKYNKGCLTTDCPYFPKAASGVAPK